MGLYQAAAAGCPGRCAPPTAVPNGRSTGWFERDGWAALEGEGRVTTGATALLVAGLDHSTGGHR